MFDFHLFAGTGRAPCRAVSTMLIGLLDKRHFQLRFCDFDASRSADLRTALFLGLAGSSDVIKYL
jgi:hypothetical protein